MTDNNFYNALRAIAEMNVTATTNHEQLAALCIAIARTALGQTKPVNMPPPGARIGG